MTARLPLGMNFQSEKSIVVLYAAARSGPCQTWKAVMARQSSHSLAAVVRSAVRGTVAFEAGSCVGFRTGVADDRFLACVAMKHLGAVAHCIAHRLPGQPIMAYLYKSNLYDKCPENDVL